MGSARCEKVFSLIYFANLGTPVICFHDCYLCYRGSLDTDTLFTDCNEQFFNKITNTSSHIVQQFIPDRITVNSNLRTRSHFKTLIPKTSDLNVRKFLIINLY